MIIKTHPAFQKIIISKKKFEHHNTYILSFERTRIEYKIINKN